MFVPVWALVLGFWCVFAVIVFLLTSFSYWIARICAFVKRCNHACDQIDELELRFKKLCCNKKGYK